MIDPVFYLEGCEIWDFLFIGDTLQLWATGITEDYLIKKNLKKRNWEGPEELTLTHEKIIF